MIAVTLPALAVGWVILLVAYATALTVFAWRSAPPTSMATRVGRAAGRVADGAVALAVYAHALRDQFDPQPARLDQAQADRILAGVSRALGADVTISPTTRRPPCAAALPAGCDWHPQSIAARQAVALVEIHDRVLRLAFLPNGELMASAVHVHQPRPD